MNWIKAGNHAFNLEAIEEVQPRILCRYKGQSRFDVPGVRLFYIGYKSQDDDGITDVCADEATEFLIGFEAVTGIRLKLPEVP